MSERIHALAQHLLGKSSLEECSLEELQHLTKRYPFFAPAQFLLLQKLKAAESPEAASQQRKAVLYYHDPLQFDYFLSGVANTEAEAYMEENVLLLQQESNALLTIAHHVTEDVTNLHDDKLEVMESNALVPLATETDEKSFVESTVFPEPDIVTEEAIIDRTTEPEVLPVTALPEEHTQFNNVRESHEPVISLPLGTESTIHQSQAEIIHRETESIPTVNHLATVTPVEAVKTPATADVLFEPYHTVDYFASQGIKFSAEDIGSKDKLSKQLRSFTEWLKIMKRLPATEIAQTPQTSAEKTVENLANHSVEGSDVVTEAMAEVWAKQGARQKAIETYNKLSLQNPSKKAYFAAKIENLKGS